MEEKFKTEKDKSLKIITEKFEWRSILREARGGTFMAGFNIFLS